MAASETSATPAPATGAPHAGRFTDRHERLLIGGGALVAFLVIWEGAVRLGLLNPLFSSSPVLIAKAAITLFAEGALWNDLRVSGIEFAVGYLIAAGIAIPLGLAAGWYKRVLYIVSPFVNALNTVPRITLVPIIIIWFGIGIWSKVVVVLLGAVIPILINTLAGVRTNEQRFLRVARSFGASDLKIFTTIVLPGTVPFIFTGLKFAAGRALLGVVVGELYAATAGIGNFIVVSGNNFAVDRVFVGIVILTVTGLVVFAVLNRIERRFDAWKPSVGSTT